VVKQFGWGTRYVDELIRVDVNQDPEDTSESNGGACERWFAALHDVNYNVIGLVAQTFLCALGRQECLPHRLAAPLRSSGLSPVS
jgi:hypothetical protein